MDAITYLRKEHTRLHGILRDIGAISDGKLKHKKFTAFCRELIRHETMEQKVLYPVLRKKKELREMISHLVSEEKSAAQAVKKIKNSSFNFVWNLRFYKFCHDVNHHAREEEKALFPKVRKILTKSELNTLGIKMRKVSATL